MPLPFPRHDLNDSHPLHGRARELNAICAALRSDTYKSGMIVALEGTHGIGKTRLLQEVRREICDFEILESSSKIGEFDRSLPFGYLTHVFGEPPIEFIQNFIHHNNPYSLRDWLYGKVLSRHKEERSQRRNKVAILLDDLHWADETSVAALHTSLPRLLQLPVALIFTWNTSRPDLRRSQLFEKPDTRESRFFEMVEKMRGLHICLPPLDATASLDLARDLTPKELQPAEIALVKRAGGNPQIIVDLIQGIQEEPEIYQPPVDDARPFGTPLPNRLHETVRNHIDSFPEEIGLTLRVAARIGESFSFDLLREQMRVNSTEKEIALIRSIHAAKRGGLLRLEKDTITFQNPLVWQSLAEGGGLLTVDAGKSADSGSQSLDSGDSVQRPEEYPESPATGLSEETSPMQWKIAKLVSKGKTNRQIARELFISPHTVDTHLRRIFKKLNISSRTELTRIVVTADPDEEDL